MTQQEIKALASQLKEQFVSEAKEVAYEVTDDAKDFFEDIALQCAKAYWKKKTGDAQDKAEAEEVIDALDIAMGSHVAELGLDFVQNGQQILLGILKTVGKTLMTAALF